MFFGDNVPKDRADKAMEAAKHCDAFLVLGSALMTMSAYRLVRYVTFRLEALASCTNRDKCQYLGFICTT